VELYHHSSNTPSWRGAQLSTGTLPNIIRVIKSRRMRWVGHVALMGEMRKAYNILVGKLEGKRPLGRHRLRW
jgi:hypothetical protein